MLTKKRLAMMNAKELAHKILSHPDVQRSKSPAPDSRTRTDTLKRYRHWETCQTEGMRRLYSAKTARGNRKRAIRNRAEEAPYALECERRNGPGSAYEAGYAVQAPKTPNYLKAIQEALQLGGLTPEVERLCQTCVAKLDTEA